MPRIGSSIDTHDFLPEAFSIKPSDFQDSSRSELIRYESMLEKNSCDLLGDEIHLLATHFLCHRRIIRHARPNTDNEGLIAHSAYDPLHVLVSLVQSANYGLIADGWQGSTLRRALPQVFWKLRRRVGHDVNGDAQPESSFS
jgi:hypothetical protein